MTTSFSLTPRSGSGLRYPTVPSVLDSQATTFSTLSTPVRSDVQVCPCVRVTLGALLDRSVRRRRPATSQCVFPRGHWTGMDNAGRSQTATVREEVVVEDLTVRDRSHERGVDQAMSVPGFPPNLRPAVSSLVAGAVPPPATRLGHGDLVPDSRRKDRRAMDELDRLRCGDELPVLPAGDRGTGRAPALVVRWAKTASLWGGIAAGQSASTVHHVDLSHRLAMPRGRSRGRRGAACDHTASARLRAL